MSTVSTAKSRIASAARTFKPHLPFEKSLPLLEAYRNTVSQLPSSVMHHLCNMRRTADAFSSLEAPLIPSPHVINCFTTPTACRLLVPALWLPALEISLRNQDLILFGMIVKEDQPLEQARSVLERAVCAANDRALAILNAGGKPNFNSLRLLDIKFDFGAEAMKLFSSALFTSTNIRVLDRKTKKVKPSGLGVSLKVREADSLDGGLFELLTGKPA